MCDYFWQRMESDHGDLADIVRAGGQIGPPSNAAAAADEFEPLEDSGWQLQHPPEPVFGLPPPPPLPPPRAEAAAPASIFGDPFVSLRDPLLNPYAGMDFFDGGCRGGGGGGRGEAMFLVAPKAMVTGGGEQQAEMMKTPCAILSKVNHQISLAGISRPSPLSPRLIKPSPMAVAEMMKASGSAAIPGPMDHGSGGVQISSPRTPGIKRRKSQAKKVVCIPAPAAASCNNRPSGEVVPSDLWAWRKYGQKPIKGSPYPRGYYRCSSSKGCSARKQVERSRTDPNMLVITYTSEHNHPWPTQRNALAGSIRSHPSKSSTSKSATTTAASNDNPLKLPATPNDEAASSAAAAAAAVVSGVVEEEEGSEMEKALEEDNELDQIYKPMIPGSDQPYDFFSDLAELESDPMSLIFSKGFMEDGGKAAAAEEEEVEEEGERGDKAALDTFNMFDWGSSS